MVSGAVGKSCIVDSLNWASHREIGMTKSTCIKCDGTIFELKVVEPQGSKFKMNFVQCKSCGGVVGVQEFYSSGALIHKLAEKLGVKLS